MMRKVAAALLVLLVVLAALVYFRASAIFSSDLVRTGLEHQLSRALGQPVAIGSIGAGLVPRLTMRLADVRIGDPARITIERLDVGTALGALLSRRIEGATLTVDGARIELPLPPLAIGRSSNGGDAAPGGVTLMSIDHVRFRDVSLRAGNRILRGDVDVVPRPGGMTIRSIRLQPGDADLDITGEITSWQGPTGVLTLRAAALDLLALQAFAADFTAAARATDGTPEAALSPATGAPMDLRITVEADRATAGDLTLETVRGTARVSREALRLDDMTFRVLGGQARATLTFAMTTTPRFDLRARLDDVDMAALMTFAGSPDTMTGRLSAVMDVAAAGTNAAAILPSARGSARVDVADGTVRGLSLVRTVVVAGSGRADSLASAQRGSEAFSRLGATLAIAGGRARTDDLRFESDDVLLDAAGGFALDGSSIDLAGRLQLSDELSQQAGRDLVRYTQEDGRVTIPVRVSGSLGDFDVTIEAAELLKRAITNKAMEEAGEAIRRGLSDLFGR